MDLFSYARTKLERDLHAETTLSLRPLIRRACQEPNTVDQSQYTRDDASVDFQYRPPSLTWSTGRREYSQYGSAKNNEELQSTAALQVDHGEHGKRQDQNIEIQQGSQGALYRTHWSHFPWSINDEQIRPSLANVRRLEVRHQNDTDAINQKIRNHPHGDGYPHCSVDAEKLKKQHQDGGFRKAWCQGKED